MIEIAPCDCCLNSDCILYTPLFAEKSLTLCIECLTRFNADIIHRADELKRVQEQFARHRGEVA